MSGRLVAPRDLRSARAAARRLDMTATPAIKTLRRLERRIRRNCWVSYEGYSLNHPKPGDVLLHLRSPGGERHSVRILPSGAMRWARDPVMFVPELFGIGTQHGAWPPVRNLELRPARGVGVEVFSRRTPHGSAIMPSIQTNHQPVTQITVVEPEPGQQAEALAVMTERARFMASQPGFISISLHRSLDGRRIVNYVQWRNRELLHAAHQSPRFRAEWNRFDDLTGEIDPHLYEVAQVIDGD